MTPPHAAPRELVLASAGAGKTHRITSRLIELLAVGEPVESILASTFTRKAAGQILERLLIRLASAALDAEAARSLSAEVAAADHQGIPFGTAEWQAVLVRVARSSHRANVGTLDSFFVRSAGSFEAELGLPPEWRLADLPDARKLTSHALQRLLASRDRARIAELLRLASRGDARRSVHEALSAILDDLMEIEEQLDPLARDAWSAFGRLEIPPAPTGEEREALAGTLLGLSVYGRKGSAERMNWRKALDRTAAAVSEGDWELVASGTLCKRMATGEHVYDGVAFPSEVLAALEAVLDATRRALKPRLVAQVESLGELARAYRTEYRETQRQTRLFGFHDLTRLIGSGDPLGARADLYYRLDGLIAHILIDEFQDTSLPQWEALAPLADEILSDEGRGAVIVADPKQSIYGWRGAEPALVHAVGERYSLPNAHLSTSWRSSQVVLDFVNRLFDGLADNEAIVGDEACRTTALEWSRDFRPHVAARELPGYVAVEVGPPDEGRGATRPELCRYAAARIASLHTEAPGFTIGVLTRTNAAVARLYLELRRLGLPVSQEGGNPLTDSAACEIALALLRLADHPGDSIAAYMVASSPLGPPLALNDHRDASSARKLAREVRTRLLHDGYGRTVGWIASLLAPFCDARDARRLSQLSELGHQYDVRSTLRPTDFVRLVEAERVEDRSTAALRVMTVHQAKGLEFDIVLLPQLDPPMVGPSALPVIPTREEPTGRITGVFPSVKSDIRCLFPELEWAERDRRVRLLRDGLSGMYVGLTRGRYALHLIVPPDAPGAKAISPARIVRAALGNPQIGREAPGSLLYEAGTRRWFATAGPPPEEFDRTAPSPPPTLHLEAGAARRMRRERPSDLHHAAGVDARELLRLDTEEAMERGRMVHLLFEQVEWVEIPLSDSDLLEVLRRSAPAAATPRLEALLAEFRSWIRNPAIRGILSRATYSGDVTVERELPFAVKRGDAMIEGVIDRVVLRRAGGAYVEADILDYKTDRIASESVGGSVERYAPQLRAYARAVADLYRIPVEKCSSRLVFVEPRLVVAVPPGRVHQPSLPLS